MSISTPTLYGVRIEVPVSKWHTLVYVAMPTGRGKFRLSSIPPSGHEVATLHDLLWGAKEATRTLRRDGYAVAK